MSPPGNPFSERWALLWTRLGGRASKAAPAFRGLMASWASPGRVYHTLEHLAACLLEFDTVRALAPHPDEAECALWYHDACYTPGAVDNEAQSAAFARTALTAGQVESPRVEHIVALILNTTHATQSTNDDAAVVNDVDLAILAVAPRAFDAYERAVRREFAMVPLALFCSERMLILDRLLQRDWIYSTETFRRRYESGARANLVRSLGRLRIGDLG